MHVFGRTAHFKQHRFHAVSAAIGLAGYLFPNGQNGLGLSEIDQVIATFHPENDPVDQVTLSRRILLLDRFPFRLSDLLKNDLLRGLCGNSTQFVHLDERADLIADLRPVVEFTSFLQRDLGLRICDRIDDDLFRDD